MATVARPSPVARPVQRVALVGLPGSGKSAVGAALARRLGWRFIDTDSLVEDGAGRTIADIFATEGEAGFRDRELEALRMAVAAPAPVVVACGGGLLTVPAASRLLLDTLCVVWLDGDDATLLSRLGRAASRPLLADDPRGRIAALRQARADQYAAAHLRVDVTDGDVEDVCDRVADAVAGARLPRALAGGDDAVHVDLGGRGYPVIVGSAVIGSVADHLPESATRVAVVADRAVGPLARHVAALLRRSGRRAVVIQLAGGEGVKTWATAGRLVTRLAAGGLERGDCVVVVGGGSVGDVAGFAAAAYLRGIAFIQAPTTLPREGAWMATGFCIGPGALKAPLLLEVPADFPDFCFASLERLLARMHGVVAEHEVVGMLDG